MTISVKRLLMIGLLAIVTASATTSSGFAAGSESSRKTTKKVAPVYPEAARRLQLTGTVRLAALVAADGRVKSTEIIGGHPLLIVAATEAVMRWRYQAADRDSRETIVFAFGPE